MTSKEKLEYIVNTTPYIDQDVKLANSYAKDIKNDLEDFEWLKSKLNLVFLDTLNNPEDKIRVFKIMGINYGETLENE